MRAWGQDDGRFAELLLYISRKCAGSPRFGSTKLNKILFYSDFLAYALLGKPITGFQYQKLPNGPAPRRVLEIRETLERSGALEVKRIPLSNGKIQIRPVALRDANPALFTAEQLAVVDRIIEVLDSADATKVSEISHVEIGWKAAEVGETIPYGTIFLSDKPLTDTEIGRIQQFAKEHGYATPTH